jgi:hypothetical protein
MSKRILRATMKEGDLRQLSPEAMLLVLLEIEAGRLRLEKLP